MEKATVVVLATYTQSLRTNSRTLGFNLKVLLVAIKLLTSLFDAAS